MELKFSATINLKPDDVRRIITEAVQSQMQGHQVTKIEFDVTKECRGYGMNEYDEVVFRAVNVTVTPKLVLTR